MYCESIDVKIGACFSCDFHIAQTGQVAVVPFGKTISVLIWSLCRHQIAIWFELNFGRSSLICNISCGFSTLLFTLRLAQAVIDQWIIVISMENVDCIYVLWKIHSFFYVLPIDLYCTKPIGCKPTCVCIRTEFRLAFTSRTSSRPTVYAGGFSKL